MIEFQNTKLVTMIAPIDTNGATATDAEVDTAGYHYAAVYVLTGNVAANMTALKLQESDSSGSGEADISGGAWTAPTAASGDNAELVAWIDLSKRKRYLSIVATGGAGATLISALCILSRADNAPTSLTGRGITELLQL